MTVAYRSIDPAPFAASIGTPATRFGPAPDLRWISIADLVIDPTYQREVLRNGARNIGKIARAFDWTKFGTVIVAPIVGGRYAIVDGQHRTTAAAACGIETVPCQIIQVDPRGQAEAFAAINGAVTAMTPLALHAARVKAADPDALALSEACAAGGVTICRYPVPSGNMKPGETLAVSALAKLLQTYGAETLALALRCITKTGNGNTGMVRADIVTALCQVLDAEPAWRTPEARLLRVFNGVSFTDLYDGALRDSRKERRKIAVSLTSILFDLLEREIRVAA